MKNISLLVFIGFSSLAWSNFSESNGIVKDNKTQLEWQNRHIKEMNAEEAIAYCQNLSLNGKGWRLPTKDELLSIVDRYENFNSTESEPQNDIALNKIFNNSAKEFAYWTSTVSEYDNRLNWAVDFKQGWAGSRSKKFSLQVRCVRGEIKDTTPMAKTFDIVKKKSKVFSDEKNGILLISGDPTPIIISPSHKEK